MEFLTTIFHLVILLAIVIVVIAWVSYNKLQRNAQNVKQKNSNVQIALERRSQKLTS